METEPGNEGLALDRHLLDIASSLFSFHQALRWQVDRAEYALHQQQNPCQPLIAQHPPQVGQPADARADLG